MKTKIISFYIDKNGETYYTDHYNRLIKNLKKINNANYDISSLSGIQDYRSVCLYKPKFILKKLCEYKAPLLWLDIDSYVHKSLQFFDTFNDMDVDFVYSTAAPDKGPCRASPLYFNYTSKAIQMIEDWANRCEDHLKNKPQEQKFDHDILLWETLPQFIDHPVHGWKQKNPLKIMAFDEMLSAEPLQYTNNIQNKCIMTMGISNVSSKKEAHMMRGDTHPCNFIGSNKMFEYIITDECELTCYSFPDTENNFKIKA